MSVLEVEHVSKKISGRLIVDDITMRVEAGEVYGFLGPNGAGKTTTIRMLVGLAKPTSGSIRIMGHDIQRQRANALMHVGTIVENPETYTYLTGRQNLVHYARLARIEHRDRRIDEVAELVGLKGRIDEKVKRYSLGMRQRLGVAQALLGNPKLLVLDEPTNGLDPAGMREFRELMRRLAVSGMAVFVSSHLLSEVQQMCDRVAILKNGRIITEERIEDLVKESVLVVRVRDANAAAIKLNAAGFSCEAVNECVVHVEADESVTPRVVRTLVAADIDIYGVERSKASLEDAFLELTDGFSAEPVQVGGAAHA
jgi:ABC-2 type transport system ATP-binding protein